MSEINPTHIVDQLDGDAIARELEELSHRADALRVLLRAARARDRGKQQRRSHKTDKGDEKCNS